MATQARTMPAVVMSLLVSLCIARSHPSRVPGTGLRSCSPDREREDLSMSTLRHSSNPRWRHGIRAPRGGGKESRGSL